MVQDCFEFDIDSCLYVNTYYTYNIAYVKNDPVSIIILCQTVSRSSGKINTLSI